jgi:hypothetical protein
VNDLSALLVEVDKTKSFVSRMGNLFDSSSVDLNSTNREFVLVLLKEFVEFCGSEREYFVSLLPASIFGGILRSNDPRTIVISEGVGGDLGSLDIIIDVTSNHTTDVEISMRRAIFLHTDVKEYWSVDPVFRKISVYYQNGGIFEKTVFGRGSIVVSRVLPNLRVRVNAVLGLR